MSYISPNLGINMKLKRKCTINFKKIQKIASRNLEAMQWQFEFYLNNKGFFKRLITIYHLIYVVILIVFHFCFYHFCIRIP